MATVECPHCTTRVIGNAAGRCPSCGGDLAEKRARSAHVRTTVSDAEPLPEVCCRCGEATSASVWLQASRTDGAVAWPLRIVYYLGVVVGGLFAPRLVVHLARGGHLTSGAGRTTATRRRVPTCKSCRRRDPPVLDHADPERGELTFAAHRRFTRALGELRASRRTG